MTISGGRAWLVLIVLILSLSLNSFFIGAIVTRHRGGDSGAGAGNGGPAQEMAAIAGFERLLRGMPEDTRHHMMGAFDAQGDEIRPAFRDLREARRETLRALGDVPFSREALADALAGVRDRTVALQMLLHGIFVDAAAAMPDEMREDMVDRWRQRR